MGHVNDKTNNDNNNNNNNNNKIMIMPVSEYPLQHREALPFIMIMIMMIMMIIIIIIVIIIIIIIIIKAARPGPPDDSFSPVLCLTQRTSWPRGVESAV